MRRQAPETEVHIFGSYDRRDYADVLIRQQQVYEDFCDHRAALSDYRDGVRSKLRAKFRALLRANLIEYERLVACELVC